MGFRFALTIGVEEVAIADEYQERVSPVSFVVNGGLPARPAIREGPRLREGQFLEQTPSAAKPAERV